jgi:hypothetical protein
MKYAALLLVVLLGACAVTPQLPPQTVTITKTVPVLPPDALYSVTGPCNHSPALSSGTVRDLANALIDERAAVDACLGDRAALRDWRSTVAN